MNVVILDTGCANLNSVKSAIVRHGYEPKVSRDPDVVLLADKLFLPGVGTAQAAMDQVRERELFDLIKACTQPVLGICLGMHLMFEAGTEHAPVDGPLPRGLGFIEGVVDAMPRTDAAGRAYKVPHVGWNSVEFSEPNSLFDGIAPGEFFYFTHSFVAPPSAATIAETVHSVTFPYAVQVPGRPVFGVQFHPEKSSDAGARLLANFATIARAARADSAHADKVAENPVASKE